MSTINFSRGGRFVTNRLVTNTAPILENKENGNENTRKSVLLTCQRDNIYFIMEFKAQLCLKMTLCLF